MGPQQSASTLKRIVYRCGQKPPAQPGRHFSCFPTVSTMASKPEVPVAPIQHRQRLTIPAHPYPTVSWVGLAVLQAFVRIAVAQMTAVGDQQANLATCTRLAQVVMFPATRSRVVAVVVQEAVAAGAAILFLPECFSFIGSSQAESLAAAQPLDGPLMAQYLALARSTGLWLSLGGFQEAPGAPGQPHSTATACTADIRAAQPEAEGGKRGAAGGGQLAAGGVNDAGGAPATAARGEPAATARGEGEGQGLGPRIFNTHCLVNPEGCLLAAYRKAAWPQIHLFDVDVPNGPVLMESRTTAPGDKLVVCPGPGGLQLGLTTCYDLRFPELYQRLTWELGAQLIAVPSAFTKITGAAHWEVLLRARAIECQAYVVAAAQAGRHNEKRESWGHAMIVDPWGEVIGRLDDPLATGAFCCSARRDAKALDCIATAEVHLARLAAVREKMPIQAHRRKGHAAYFPGVNASQKPQDPHSEPMCTFVCAPCFKVRYRKSRIPRGGRAAKGHGDMGQRTCRASTRTEHIIMSESVYSLSHTSSFPDACHEFDHSPITLSFKAPAQATTPIHTCNADCHTGPQLQWKPDQAARYVGALIALEEEVMAVQQAVEQGTHPDSINRFVHDIISRAAGSAGMLKPRLCPLARVDKHTTVKPAWFDRSCKEAKAALWQALRSGEALHLYRARKQAYRRLVARAKSAWSKHRAAKLLDMLKHNPGDALKMLRVKHARQQSMVPIDKWHQHLQAYFTTTIAAHEAPDVIPEPAWTRQAVPAHLQAVPLGRGRPHSVPAPAPVTTHAPTYKLPHLDNITSIVQAQLRELNNDTAPGLDGVPAPFIKHARTVEEGVTTYLLLPLLATWFHSMMRTGCIPAAWKVARISPLFKDTDPTDPNKYRMLAVISVLYRLYANVLRHVLTAWCMTHKVLPAEQFGFIPGRSTMQPMFILRHLVHAQKASADAKHRKLYTAFIDFKQAYDHIPRQQLWEHLRVGVKLPQPLLACLEGLYRDDSYVLIDGPHRTPPVIPDQGVKQGCPISPLLFALYVHDISKEFLGPVDAVRVQGTPVTHFMYADDLTLVSTSPHGLQRLVCQLQGFADRKHLAVNVGKSKVMVFNGNSQTAAPRIGYKHEILPVVREFKYLGMHFNPSATPAFAATHMRAGMFLAMRQACKRARDYGVLHDPYALCHLIRAFVLPLGLYGSQVWGTAFLGHGMQLSNPVQTRMLSFLRFAARVRGSVSGLMVLHELGQLPLQLYWLRAACKFWNTAKLSHSDLLMRVIKADVELGRGCQASWSAQFQLAARELMGGEFTLSPDMVLGTKAMEVKWLE
ncbi:hypothetical protein QJQ45_014577, partial [Haematococcus lacustris]